MRRPLVLAGVALLAGLTALAVGAAFLTADRGARTPNDGEVERLRPLYPRLTRTEIRELLIETRNRPYVYEPFTQFREREFHGRWVNSEAWGVRRGSAPQPWPPAADRPAVFVFGGSTAFGYGQPDDSTLPAQLERHLAAGSCLADAAVYNLARSNYYSSQERVLFERLLVAGIVPDLAIFVDGINEFVHPRDEPKFTGSLRRLMAEQVLPPARRAISRLLPSGWLRGGAGFDSSPTESPRSAASPLVDRYLRNRRLIAAAAAEFGVDTLFVWQPAPVFRHGLERPPADGSGVSDLPAAERMREGYRELDRRRRRGEVPGLLWLADLQAGRSEPLYVDRLHYTAAFTGELAAKIAGALPASACSGGPGADREHAR